VFLPFLLSTSVTGKVVIVTGVIVVVIVAAISGSSEVVRISRVSSESLSAAGSPDSSIALRILLE
jgi:hypothetical protein